MHRVRKDFFDVYIYFGFLPPFCLILRMEVDLDKLIRSSHPYDESAVKLPFGGNVPDKFLADNLVNPSFYPSCYIWVA